MEFFGVMAFMLVMFYFGLPDKVKKLQAKVKKLETKITGGKSTMSDILKELEGKNCTLILESDFSPKLKCRVEKVDEDWIKVVETGKKGQGNVRLLKIDNVKEVAEIE